MLFTKSIYKAASPDDGLRVSVMSRHTLDDGVTLDPRINEKSYDVWLRDLAPPQKLVGRYLRMEVPFEEYEREYKAYLRPKKSLVEDLARLAMKDDITLLCKEETADLCHRRILSEECQKYFPLLKVEHR